MIQLGEVIQRVQSLYSKGLQSKDSRLTSRHIYSAVLTARSILLKQQSNKNQNISEWNYQIIPCAELIKASIHECGPAPAGCMILRTKYKIPRPINNLSQLLIRYITTLDGSISFDGSNFQTEKYSKGNKYTPNKPSYFVKNGFIYITVMKQLKAVTICLLAEDPLEVIQFPILCSDVEECNCCDITEMEFPIDRDLIKPVIDLAAQELIVLFKQMTEDKRSNSQDDDNMSSGMIHQPNG